MTLTIITAALNAHDNLLLMYEDLKCLLSSDIEWIICNSSRSVDDTFIYFKFKPFVRILTVNDTGIYDAINQGILAAHGEWIVILGSDDMIFSCINKIITLLDPKEFIYALPYTLGNSSRIYHRSPTTIFHFLRGMPLSHQCLVVKKNLYSKHPYSTKYRYASDFHWLLKLFLRGYKPVKFYYHFPVVNMSLSGISSNINSRICIACEFLEILRSFSFPFYFYIPLQLSLLKTKMHYYFLRNV